MKEYDEDTAMRLMLEAEGAGKVDEDTAAEVLDLIFDYYDENGDLDINFDDEDDEPDIAAMVAYVQKYLHKNGAVNLSDAKVEAMVLAEIAYEESLL